MTAADRVRWDAKYAERTPPETVAPPEWLVKHASALKPGRALDLACGFGDAALWLAARGWNVTAVDASPVGLKAAAQRASSQQLSLEWISADLDEYAPGEGQYDLITVFRFLDRVNLPGRIVAALRPDGRLLYETFLAGCSPCHVQNPAYLLQMGELPRLFSELLVIDYEERITPQASVARLAAERRN